MGNHASHLTSYELITYADTLGGCIRTDVPSLKRISSVAVPAGNAYGRPTMSEISCALTYPCPNRLPIASRRFWTRSTGSRRTLSQPRTDKNRRPGVVQGTW